MLALVCAVALVGSTRWASAATVAEIAKNPAAFDQKTVTVSGTAGEVSSRTSRRRNPYTTFRLSDQGEAVKVFTFGTPTIKDGERVEVRGVFHSRRRGRDRQALCGPRGGGVHRTDDVALK